MKNIFLICIISALSLPASGGISSFDQRKLSDLEKKQELLKNLRKGQTIISKAIVVQDEEAICSLDLKNREELIPPFAGPVPENFRSSVELSENIPSCGEEDIGRMPHRESSYIVEGEQTALLPLAIGLGGALLGGGIGCSIGYFQDFAESALMEITNKQTVIIGLREKSGLFVTSLWP